MTNAESVQCSKRIDQSGSAPIEHVIVGESAAIDAGDCKASRILGADAVVYSLGQKVLAARDAGFQVDDACIWPHAIELLEGRTPDVGQRQGCGDRAIRPLRQAQIVGRRTHVPFVDLRLAGTGQRLIDAAAQHHIAAQEEAHDCSVPRTKGPLGRESRVGRVSRKRRGGGVSDTSSRIAGKSRP